MVNITPDAVNDISDYYYNVMCKYPNTWDITDVYNQVDKVMDEITIEADRIIGQLSLVHGQVTSPLLKKLQKDGMVEAFVKKSQWTFTLRYNNGDFFVDNAIKGHNMSNRARRRGVSNPRAPLSDDDRTTQTRQWESRNNTVKISETDLRKIIFESIRRVLN